MVSTSHPSDSQPVEPFEPFEPSPDLPYSPLCIWVWACGCHAFKDPTGEQWLGEDLGFKNKSPLQRHHLVKANG